MASVQRFEPGPSWKPGDEPVRVPKLYFVKVRNFACAVDRIVVVRTRDCALLDCGAIGIKKHNSVASHAQKMARVRRLVISGKIRNRMVTAATGASIAEFGAVL